MIDFKDFALVAAAGGVVAAWNQIRGLFKVAMATVFVPIRLQRRNSRALCSFCFYKMKRFSMGAGQFTLAGAFRRSAWRDEAIAAEELDQAANLFFYGWVPLLLLPKKSGEGKNGDDGFTVYYIRGTLNFDKLMLEMAKFVNALTLERKNRFSVTTPHTDSPRTGNTANGSPTPPSDSPIDHGEWHLDPLERAATRLIGCSYDDLGRRTRAGEPLKALAITPEMYEVVKDIDFWMEHREWYAKRNIPWRLGFLFYGDPGTGKTSLARTCAEHFDIPVYLIDLAAESNHSLRRTWKVAMSNAPCMVVIEDLDGVFNKRTRTNARKDQDAFNSDLTFDGLINVIDGIDKADGILLVITTNKPHMLDEALAGVNEEGDAIVTRPGRIDRCLKFVPLTREGRQQIAETILDETPDLIPAVVSNGEGRTGAQFTCECVTLARNELWKRKRNGQN